MPFINMYLEMDNFKMHQTKASRSQFIRGGYEKVAIIRAFVTLYSKIHIHEPPLKTLGMLTKKFASLQIIEHANNQIWFLIQLLGMHSNYYSHKIFTFEEIIHLCYLVGSSFVGRWMLFFSTRLLGLFHILFVTHT